MRLSRRAFVVLMVVSTAGAVLAQSPAAGLTAARQTLGTENLTSATVEFSYEAAVAGAVTEGKTVPYKGKGKLLYVRPGKYRLERVRSEVGGQSLQVAIDDGTQYARWWFRDGRTERAAVDAAALSADRKRLEREVMVYLAALLLAETDFTKYEARGAEGTYVVIGARGSSAEIVVRDGRVQEIQYVRPRAMPIATTPGGTSARPEQTQDVRARVSDFRRAGAGVLPHRFRAEYEQGWEELTIDRYVLNVPIPESQFQPPPGAGKE